MTFESLDNRYEGARGEVFCYGPVISKAFSHGHFKFNFYMLVGGIVHQLGIV